MRKLDFLNAVRRVGRPLGMVMYGVAAAMALCAAAGLLFEIIGYVRPEIDHGSVLAFLFCATLTAAAGALFRTIGFPIDDEHLSRRDAIVMTVGIWTLAGLFGSLPYMIDAQMTPADALFETLSGFTTTGATVIGDIEQRLSRPLLLWRSLTQWLGGMGIVVLFVAVFPKLGAGGKHLFRAEVPGPTASGLVPRIAETAMWLYGMYLALTIAEIIALLIFGMPTFEAICHSLTTVSTGGFSTRDASIGAYDSTAIHVTISLFMIASGVNFSLYYMALRGRKWSTIYRSVELRTYLALVAISVTMLTIINLPAHPGDVGKSLQFALFTTGTFITSTGYGVEDYMTFPPLGLAVIIGLMWVGGCAGSTAGGMKVSRLVLMFKSLIRTVRGMVRPNVVQIVRMDGARVPDGLLVDVSGFLVLYGLTVFFGTFALAGWEGTEVPTAFGAVLTSVSNMGPAPFYQGSDNFASYASSTKVAFSFLMVLGRLEFITLLALLVPDVWEA